MDFAEEWAAAVRSAAAGTRLNGWSEGPGTGRDMPPVGGGAASELRISTAALRDLSKKSGTLHGRVNAALADLGHAHAGLTAATDGFASTTTLGKVRGSWEGRLRDVRGECERLRTAFTEAAKAHDGTEDDTKDTMSSLSRSSPWHGSRLRSPIADFS